MSGPLHFMNRYKGSLAALTAASYIALDVWRINYRKDVHKVGFASNKPVPGILGPEPCISPSLQEIIDEVKSELNLPLNKKKFLNYHVTAQVEPKVTGFESSLTQIDVFLPDYWNISKAEQLSAKAARNLIFLLGQNCDELKKSDWMTPDAMSLLNSFLLSKRAKKYAIAQLSYSHYNSDYFWKYAIFTMFSLGILVSAALIEERVQGNLPTKLAIFAVFIMPLYLMSRVLGTHSEAVCEMKSIGQAVSRNMVNLKDLKKDSNLDLIDEEMLNGAIEYYSKIVQRKKALYRLFSPGFNVSGMLTDSGESLNPMIFELPKQDVVNELEEVKNKLRNVNKLS